MTHSDTAVPTVDDASRQAAPGGADRRTARRLALLLVLAPLVAYLPSLSGGFIWDDAEYVYRNPTLRSVDGLRRIWFDTGASPQYYPLVFTTFWIEYRLWGLNTLGYRVVNVLLHGLTALLAWRALRRLEVPGAWAAAAVFALHPVHVESVAWITERKNVLSSAFYFGSLLAYLRLALPTPGTAPAGRRVGLYVLSLLLFVAALFSKTVTCTLPGAMLLVVWWKRGRLALPDILRVAPFLALGLGMGLLTAKVEQGHVASGAAWDHSFLERCLIAGRVVWFYAAKLVWPVELMFFYPRWRIDAHQWTQYLYPLALLAALLVLWLGRRRLGTGPLVAALCFVGTLFPALGFFDVYFMQYSFVADHFQYLASVPLIALILAGGLMLVRRALGLDADSTRIVLVVLLALLGSLTWRQSRVYRTEEGLWRDAIHKNPAAWPAYNNLGIAVQTQGKLDEAARCYRQALAIKPDCDSAYCNLGALLASQNRPAEALDAYRRALEINPDLHEAHSNLGRLLVALQRYDEGIAHFREAVRLVPGFPHAHGNLGTALLLAGQPAEAIVELKTAIDLWPAFAEGHYNLGLALAALGRHAEAAESFRAALRLDANYPGARENLEQALRQARAARP